MLIGGAFLADAGQILLSGGFSFAGRVVLGFGLIVGGFGFFVGGLGFFVGGLGFFVFGFGFFIGFAGFTCGIVAQLFFDYFVFAGVDFVLAFFGLILDVSQLVFGLGFLAVELLQVFSGGFFCRSTGVE